ncbi:MAG TPA: bacillithiol biosynthesis deacetylase BshB1 [Vicinamibacteria bacterium]|nr:bacillithiol biosynthesis deacetylase BshB1 [Vicinamibacteria bacterium]
MDGFDIATVCAHPDDAELVTGGTIAREAARGRRIAMVDLTRGESGSRGTPETRAAEAAEAARILGAAHRESLGLPDARLQAIPEHKDPMVEAIRRLRPRLVILQHWEQRHPDHAAASRIVYDACFLAGLRSYRPDLGPAFRPAKLVYTLTMTEASDLAPSFVVDVTAFWETKRRAIAAFASQFTPAPGEKGSLPLDRFQDSVELAGRRHGQRIGVRYGEGFVTREPLAVDDLLSLGGTSL